MAVLTRSARAQHAVIKLQRICVIPLCAARELALCRLPLTPAQPPASPSEEAAAAVLAGGLGKPYTLP